MTRDSERDFITEGSGTAYERVDREGNVWQCLRCGHIRSFEADGPLENDALFCEHCGRPISFVEVGLYGGEDDGGASGEA